MDSLFVWPISMETLYLIPESALTFVGAVAWKTFVILRFELSSILWTETKGKAEV